MKHGGSLVGNTAYMSGDKLVSCNSGVIERCADELSPLKNVIGEIDTLKIAPNNFAISKQGRSNVAVLERRLDDSAFLEAYSFKVGTREITMANCTFPKYRSREDGLVGHQPA